MKVTVEIATRDELIGLDVPSVERRLDGARRAKSRLDGYEATLVSALTVLRNRPPKPEPLPSEPESAAGAVPDSQPAAPVADADRPMPDEAAPAPKPSSRQQREAAARAGRLFRFPHVAAALNDGRITTEQADLVAIDDLPAHVVAELLAKAIQCGSTDLTRQHVVAARRAHDRLNPQQRLARQKLSRSARWWIDEDTGMYCLFAQFDPITGDPIFDRLNTLERAEWQKSDKAGSHNKRRTARQRNADVVIEILAGKKAKRPGKADSGGLHLIIDLHSLQDVDNAEAVGWTTVGVPVPAAECRALLDSAEVYAWVLSANDNELNLHRTHRFATSVQKMALTVRDGGCVWAGCNMPAGRSDAHHCAEWDLFGPTNLNNLAMLCPSHHQQLHSMGLHLAPCDNAGHWKLVDSRGQTRQKWANPPPRSNKCVALT